MTAPLSLSQRARQTEDQPISYFMRQAVENPHLISLAAGLVDAEALPCAEVGAILEDIFKTTATAQAALQYGTTQGLASLREKILAHLLQLDRASAADLNVSIDDIVVTTGSQQLLYLVGEVLLNPGDIVITEAPSYFVYQGTLTSLGVRTMQVPMDEQGMNTDALEELLERLDHTGELERVRMIYTVNYFQNPTGLTLSLARRHKLMELVRKFSKKQRILILEDAAYRELRFEGQDLPSIKSLDTTNEYVILGMTFSKPLAPGLKTGYGLMPSDIRDAVLRFKGNHDFGSSNLNQHILDRMLDAGHYQRQVEKLNRVYRHKRDTMLIALEAEFPKATRTSWTYPEGGLYVWLTCPDAVETGPGSKFMKACVKEGVLYVPGEFCYDKADVVRRTEARLCYGVASPEQITEAIKRMARAARESGLPRVSLKSFAGCRG